MVGKRNGWPNEEARWPTFLASTTIMEVVSLQSERLVVAVAHQECTYEDSACYRKAWQLEHPRLAKRGQVRWRARGANLQVCSSGLMFCCWGSGTYLGRLLRVVEPLTPGADAGTSLTARRRSRHASPNPSVALCGRISLDPDS